MTACDQKGRRVRSRVSLLDIAVETGEDGPVVKLAGEADTSVAGQLSDALNAQISGGTRHLTVDLSGLRFADSAAIRTLVDAHLALQGQGGTLELANPQPLVARTLNLLGIDQVIPVRPQAGPAGGSLRNAYRSKSAHQRTRNG
jgi:anti-sigma B factor antagonist